MRPLRWLPLLLLLAIAVLAAGCASHMVSTPKGQKPYVTVPTAGKELVKRFAPAFLIINPQDRQNLIGEPKARPSKQDGKEEIFVDPANPLIYYETRRFWTKNGWCQNLIYRVHFMGTPFGLPPFSLGWGDNTGLMVFVTLDKYDAPVLVSTVATCGCYVSFTATNYTPSAMMPKGWLKNKHTSLYGADIPTALNFASYAIPRILITLAPGEHRVVNIEVLDGTKFKGNAPYQISKADLTPMESLKELAAGKGQKTTSFYHHGSGYNHGYVKGAFKPMEFLFLGLISMDYRVGQDKEYGNIRNPFYTSLMPWNHMASDMNDYPRFLRFHGWKP